MAALRPWTAIATAAVLGSGAASAEESHTGTAQAKAAADTVAVTATRIERPVFELPASVDVRPIEQRAIGVNLSESLGGVAGLLARDRQNYAQDTQLSVRGFGARSTFGIRGVRLYLDGIPATQPDGQGQVSHFNLASADRVEVLRGPFSALYGNSSGGVIQMFTADGRADPLSFGGFAAGSYDSWRASAGRRGVAGPIDYGFAYSRFDTQGFRDHSAAERHSLQGKLRLDFGGVGRISLLLNDFDSPEAQDPLGLTREQADAAPRQAAAQARQFDTRKSVAQTQGGLIYELDFGSAQSLRLLAYRGNRGVQQFLAIPVEPQNSPRHSGGMVDLDTDYAGGEARWSWRGQLASRDASLVLGVSYDDLSQHRRGYENFVGQAFGVRGGLRRDEINDVAGFDQYLQAHWDFAERWSLLAGLRSSRVEFESDDRYIATGNGDDSGRANYDALSPVAGLAYKPTDDWRLYASYGRGFETPTLVELAYRPDLPAQNPCVDEAICAPVPQPGLNFDLDAATSDNLEAGLKFRLRPRLDLALAAFQADTEDELAVATNSGGRSTYRNIGRTRRRGAEATAEARLSERLRLSLAYTWLDAQVRDPYRVCTGAPCTAASTPVPAGSDIPGVPGNAAFAELRWGDARGWQFAVGGEYVGRVAVDDINSESADSYVVADARVAYVLDTVRWRLQGFVRVDNVFDRQYIGSVIVNDGNGRYYEPGPGRSVLGGFSLGRKG